MVVRNKWLLKNSFLNLLHNLHSNLLLSAEDKNICARNRKMRESEVLLTYFKNMDGIFLLYNHATFIKNEGALKSSARKRRNGVSN